MTMSCAIDVANCDVIWGWACDAGGSPLYLDAIVNDVRRAIVPCDVIRSDGLNNGFVFHPKPFLDTGVNSVVLRERGSGLTVYSAKLVRQEAGASVLLGKKDYLFLASTPDNNILQELIGQVSLGNFLVKKYQTAFRFRNLFFSAMRTKYIFSIIPDKSVALEHLLPDGIRISRHRPADIVGDIARTELGSKYINVEHAFGDDEYHITDSHFNYKGAASYFTELMMKANLLEQAIMPDVLTQENFVGDLAAAGAPAETVTMAYYRPDLFEMTVDDLVNGTAFKKTRNIHGRYLKVGVVGTSSAALLFPFFAGNFRDCFFHFSNTINVELVMQENPDVLFHLPSERVLRSVPDDRILLKLRSDTQ